MVNEIETHGEVQIIPIAAIAVENPRERSEKTFHALVDSIGKVGLKKPITVARDDTATGDAWRLVCGQGRMEAYVALGETHIPAIVVEGTSEVRCGCGASYPTCPDCEDGWLVERSGSFGKFLGCVRYPSCVGKAKISRGERAAVPRSRRRNRS